MPTIISYSSLREIVEQNVDIPVPHGRDGREGLLGLHPRQSSTAFSGADHRSVTAEQIVDIPAPRGGRVLHPASSSSGLQGTANPGSFRTFPQNKKSAKLGPHPSPRVPASVSSSTLAAQPVSDSWWASLAPAQQAELEEARAEVRREHVSKRKRKKKRKRKLPRVSSCGYKFLPRSRRVLGMDSTLSLRDGEPWLLRSILAASCPHGCLQAQDARRLGGYGPEGLFCCDTVTKSVARAVGTWKHGLSTSPGIWQLLVRCSSCLNAVVEFSGNSLLDLFPYSALFGLTMDECVCQSTKAWVWLVAMHLALCCPRRTGILDYLGDGVYFFFGPLYLEVTCSSFCLRSTGLLFLGDASRNGFSIQRSSWFNSGYMFGISLRCFFRRT